MDRYRRAMPGNKKVRELQVRIANEIHAKRIRDMRPAIDNKQPRGFGTTSKDGKKRFLMEERYQQIEYDNRLLLERMSEIMKQANSGAHKQDQHTVPRSRNGSLNKDGRRKQLMKITQDNQLLLRRIQTVRPEYDHVRWAEDAKRQLQYKKAICEYPPLELRGSRR